MIKTTELRLGNWIQYLGTPMKIDEEFLCLWCDKNSDLWDSDFDPIELTEEILLKCGFVKDSDYVFIKNDRWKVEETITRDGYLFRIQISRHESIGLSCIKHLHQLQNIYFALTNKELEYKP